MFVTLHLSILSVFWIEPTVLSLCLCGALYFVRMFGVTAGYHRLLSHRSYECPRFVQFLLACLGCSAMQNGPLWWADQHRDHHKYSDREMDPHSPVIGGFFWAHIGWLFVKSPAKDASGVRDLEKFPELRWLDRLNLVPGLCVLGFCFLLDGLAGIVWGFMLSTILLYHGTFLVNSVCHVFGKRRFATDDQSKDNGFVAILTLGEGWHNCHHARQARARHGIYWWQLDPTYWVLCLLSLLKLVRGLFKPAPETIDAVKAT